MGDVQVSVDRTPGVPSTGECRTVLHTNRLWVPWMSTGVRVSYRSRVTWAQIRRHGPEEAESKRNTVKKSLSQV